MKSIARQLNGRINLYRGAGHYATWYIPAVIGLYNVYDASPEMRVRTLFEEGFAIVGGFLGTELGASLGGFIAISALGLGPLGLFVTVFIFATAGGILGSFIGIKFGDQVYDLQERVGDIICHSPNELIGAIQ
jgi:hypothetical protein